jgi:hypothetical protein
VSLAKDHLAGRYQTWTPRWTTLGLDFQQNYLAARHWLDGGDPYKQPYGDPLNRPYVYSPVVLAAFSWCKFAAPRQALLVWTGALAVMASIGAAVAWKTRRRLGLSPLPFLFVLAAVLLSTPVLFAMERGNCDMLVLMLVLVTAAVLHKPSLACDLAAGICLALATWIKIYPGALGIGLVGARRPRALACMALAYVGIGLADYHGTLESIEAVRTYVAEYNIPFHVSAHPLTTYWSHFWEGTRLAMLARLPAPAAAAFVLLPGILWVTAAIFRCRNRNRLLVPYLMWLTAAATFAAPVSNDYNLFFLPLAALAVWDRRDPMIVHLMMAPLLFWWQPIQLPIGADLLFVCKLIALYSVGISLTIRAGEQGQGSGQKGMKSGQAARPPALAA